MAGESIARWLGAFARAEASAAELLDRCLAAIDARNRQINAIPTLIEPRRLREQARAIDARFDNGEPMPLLSGMPWVSKDIFATAGVRTTFGSPIFADHVPEADTGVVSRLRAAGALLIGKSNTPEFAAGSQTFNPVLGRTCSPYDAQLTAGGSSGGAAAAIATGMALVADGSDLAASLRNPASFCGVVGLRVSSYCNPALQPELDGFNTLSTVGTLAATVTDCQIGYQALFDPPPARPIKQWSAWLDQLHASTPRTKPRLAYSADCSGQMPLANAVRRVFADAIARLREAGFDIVEAHPDFSGADQCFQTLRALYFVAHLGELYQRERARMKDTVVWNIEQGLALSAPQIGQALRQRSVLFERMRRFTEHYDGWLLPTAQVLPFALDTAYPTDIDGQPLATYIDWLKSCYWISVTGHPALSLPCGHAPRAAGAALPVGMQVVGRFNGESQLFGLARQIEAALA